MGSLVGWSGLKSLCRALALRPKLPRLGSSPLRPRMCVFMPASQWRMKTRGVVLYFQVVMCEDNKATRKCQISRFGLISNFPPLFLPNLFTHSLSVKFHGMLLIITDGRGCSLKAFFSRPSSFLSTCSPSVLQHPYRP